VSTASPDAISKHMALPFIEHDRRERINTFGIITPQAAEGTAFEKDIRSHSISVVDRIPLYVENSEQLVGIGISPFIP
jgi:hypothetical protein